MGGDDIGVGTTAALGPAEELERSIAQLEREKRIVEVLYRVGQAVAREHDLQEIVQLVTDEATAIVGACFGAFFYDRVGEEGQAYSLYALSGLPRERFARFPLPRATDVFRPVYEGTAIVRLDDVTADPRYGRTPPHHGLPPGHPPVRSYLAVPVLSTDGVAVGGLFFGHERAGVFTEEHERIVTGIATQAGMAISKARLLEAERRARAEAEARADAALSLDHVSDGVVMVDADGVIRLWNRAAARIVGVEAEAVVGRPIGEAVPGWERIALRVPVGERDRASRPRTLPLDGEAGELWVSVYGVEFPGGTVYAFRDVTAEQRLEEVRSDLIATVSHEIRTPVAAVYGAARTLLRDDLSEEVTERLVEILASESERLAALVSEILLAGSIDSDRIAIARTEIDLAETVVRAVESAGLARGGAQVTLELPPTPARAVADPDRVGQVLANLLENAAKYGANGRGDPIVVRLREGSTTVRVEVTDRGRGIPPSEQERIFEKFYRLDPQLENGVRGTGLGLYISRELVSRMQGTMGVESAEGDGATFWFELPRPWAAVAGSQR